MDEYSMSWSDAARAEADFFERQAVPEPADNVHQFGTLGRALWRERSLAWMLRLNSGLPPEDARRIVAALRAASRPLRADRVGSP